MMWRGICVKQTIMRGALKTCGLRENRPWAHSVGPFPAGAGDPTQPNPPLSSARPLNQPLHSRLALHPIGPMPLVW